MNVSQSNTPPIWQYQEDWAFVVLVDIHLSVSRRYQTAHGKSAKGMPTRGACKCVRWPLAHTAPNTALQSANPPTLFSAVLIVVETTWKLYPTLDVVIQSA